MWVRDGKGIMRHQNKLSCSMTPISDYQQDRNEINALQPALKRSVCVVVSHGFDNRDSLNVCNY